MITGSFLCFVCLSVFLNVEVVSKLSVENHVEDQVIGKGETYQLPSDVFVSSENRSIKVYIEDDPNGWIESSFFNLKVVGAIEYMIVVDIVVFDGFAFLADSTYGLRILNISNPDVTTSGVFCGFSTKRVIFDSSNLDFVYVLVDEGLKIIDVADKFNPKIVGSFDMEYIASADVNGEYVYLVGKEDSEDLLVIVDVSEPNNPILKGNVGLMGEAHDLTFQSDEDEKVVFVVVVSGNDAYLTVFDVKEITTPENVYTSLGLSKSTSDIYRITVAGNTVIILFGGGEGKFEGFEFSGFEITYQGSFDSDSTIDMIGVFPSGSRLYVARAGGMTVFNNVLTVPGMYTASERSNMGEYFDYRMFFVDDTMLPAGTSYIANGIYGFSILFWYDDIDPGGPAGELMNGVESKRISVSSDHALALVIEDDHIDYNFGKISVMDLNGAMDMNSNPFSSTKSLLSFELTFIPISVVLSDVIGAVFGIDGIFVLDLGGVNPIFYDCGSPGTCGESSYPNVEGGVTMIHDLHISEHTNNDLRSFFVIFSNDNTGMFVYYLSVAEYNIATHQINENFREEIDEDSTRIVGQRDILCFLSASGTALSIYSIVGFPSSTPHETMDLPFSLDFVANDIFIQEDSVFLIGETPGPRLQIIDVSDDHNPYPVGSFTFGSEYPNTKRVFVKGIYAYVLLSDDSDGKSEVVVLDVSDKDQPTIIDTFTDFYGKGYDMDIQGNFAFVADGFSGLKVLGGDLVIYDSPQSQFVCGNVSVSLKAEELSNGIPVGNETETFSIGRGNCNDVGYCDDYTMCYCFQGYSSSTENQNCDTFYCHGKLKGTFEACSGHGICSKKDLCSCEVGFEEEKCEVWRCGGYVSEDIRTCSGKGTCKNPNDCKCEYGQIGKSCETNMLYATILAPVLVASSLVTLLILIILCCICCSICCIGFAVLVLCVCGLCCVTFRQTRGLRTYGKLRNFDMLLKEQELEDDGKIAHLRINKDLFQLNMDDIKTVSILGEGGSSSVVFKALWSGKTVAFKCFKTRTMMSTQDKYDEFEKEVEILSSIAHPSIIRFFGACLRSPRVGILMEFCPKGEILDFVKKFRERFFNEYPLLQKIRMLSEVCSALEYLHSRNIIHRDLKCENVLISEDEHAKLMDFGLSRCVESMSVQKTKRIGTSVYMSPEIVQSGSYDSKADVFSFAIMLYILVTEVGNPYEGMAEEFQVEFRVANDPKFRPDMMKLELSSDFEWLKEVIETCWDHDPSNRYTCNEIREILQTKGSIEKFEKDHLKNKKKMFGLKNKNNNNVIKVGDGGEKDEEYEQLEVLLKSLQIEMKDLEEINYELKIQNREMKQKLVK